MRSSLVKFDLRVARLLKLKRDEGVNVGLCCSSVTRRKAVFRREKDGRYCAFCLYDDDREMKVLWMEPEQFDAFYEVLLSPEEVAHRWKDLTL